MKTRSTLMTLNRAAYLTVALFALSACATTISTTDETTTEATTVSAQASMENEGDLICKLQTIVGSKFKRQVCGTAEQWDELTQSGRGFTASVQDGWRNPGPQG